LRAMNYASDELNKVKEQTQRLREVGSQLQQTGLTMMGWGAAIAAPFGLALKQFMGFEEEMRNVNAVMQGTEEDFAALSTTIREVAGSSSFLSQEVASAAYALASAGKKKEDIQAMIGPVVDLAEAMHAELQPTAELVTDTLDQFGLSAQETGRVVNIFATSVGNSPETLERLAYGMRYAGSAAAGFDYSLEETVAALMAFETAGIHGEQAGTTLRNALARLAAPTKDVVDALKMYGLTIDDVNPAQHSFVEILETMRRAGVDTTGAYEIFGTEIGGRMAAAISTGVEKIRDFTSALEDSAGAAEEMKEEQLNSLSGQIKLLKSSFEELGISFAELFKDEVKKAIEWVRGLTEWFKNLDDGTKNLIINVAKWGSIILIGAGAVNSLTGTVMKTIASFKSWASVITSTIKFLGQKVSAIAQTIQAMGGLSGIAKTVGEKLSSIGSVVSSLGTKLIAFATNPVTLTIAAIAGITAGAIALWNIMDDLSKDWFKSDLEKALNQTREAADGTVESMEEVSRRFSKLSVNASEAANRLAGTIAGTFSQLEDAVKGFDHINSTVAVKTAMNMQRIAEEAGYTGEAFKDLAKEFSESITLSTEEVTEKLKKTMEEVDSAALDTEIANRRMAESLEAAKEAMANSAKEIEGTLTSLSETSGVTAEAIEKSSTKQSAAIEFIKSHSEDTAQAFVEMTEQMRNSANSASREVGLAMSTLALKLVEQGELADEEAANILELYSTYEGLKSLLEDVVKAYGSTSDEAKEVQRALEETTRKYANTGLAMSETLVELKGVKDLTSEIATILENTGEMKLDLDASGAVESLEEVSKSIRETTALFKSYADTSVVTTELFLNAMAQQKKAATEATDTIGFSLAKLFSEWEAGTEEAKEHQETLLILMYRYEAFQKEIKKLTDTYGENSDIVKKANQAIKELRDEITKTAWKMAEAETSGGNLNKVLKALEDQSGDTGEAFNELLYETEKLSKAKDNLTKLFGTAVTDSTERVNIVKDTMTMLQKAATDTSKAIDPIGIAFADLAAQMGREGMIPDSNVQKLQELQKSIEEVNVQLDDAKNRYGKNSDVTRTYERELAKLKETYSQSGKAISGIVIDTIGLANAILYLKETTDGTAEELADLYGLDPALFIMTPDQIAAAWNKAQKEIENANKWQQLLNVELGDAPRFFSASAKEMNSTLEEQRRRFNNLTGAARELMSRLLEYSKLTDEAFSAGDTKSLIKYRSELGKIVREIDSIQKEFSDVGGELAKLEEFIEANSDATGQLGLDLRNMSEYLEPFRYMSDAFSYALDDIEKKSKDSLEKTVSYFQDAYDTLYGHSIIPDLQKGISDEMRTMADNVTREANRGAVNAVASFTDLSKGLSNYLSKMRKEAGEFSLDRVSTAANEIPEYFSSLSKEASSAINNIRKIYNLDWLDETFRETAGMTRNMSGILREFQRETNDISRELGEFMPNGGDLTVPKIERKKEYHIFLDIRKEEYADKDELIRKIARELELAGEI